MKPARYLVSLTALLWVGCGVMHFQNGEAPGQPPEGWKWRHNSAYSLLEMGAPVNLAKLCPGGWSEVTTQLTFLDAMLGSVDNLATLQWVPGGFDFWQPQTVKYRCRE